MGRRRLGTLLGGVGCILLLCAWVGSTFIAGAGVNLTDGLVAHWALDDGTGSSTASDSSPSGYDGTLSGMDVNTDWITGHVGSDALDFTGADTEHVDVSGVAADFETLPLSFSFWFKLAQLPSVALQDMRLFGKRHAGTPFHSWYFRVQDSNDKIEFIMVDTGSATKIAESDSAVTTGQWYHVVGTADGTTMTLYVDTVAQTDTETISSVFDANSTIQIGRSISLGINGQMDDVRIYAEVLSAQKRQALFALGG